MGNLCVSNLDDTVDDERLRKEFQRYGTVINAKVIIKQGQSIGIGYVSFSRPDDAIKSIGAMNGRIVGTKPIIVYLTDGISSSLGQKRLLAARVRRPDLLEIANVVAEQRKPDMATIFRIPSPPDTADKRIFSFESV